MQRQVICLSILHFHNLSNFNLLVHFQPSFNPLKEMNQIHQRVERE